MQNRLDNSIKLEGIVLMPESLSESQSTIRIQIDPACKQDQETIWKRLLILVFDR
jgi:hypothetical protein